MQRACAGRTQQPDDFSSPLDEKTARSKGEFPFESTTEDVAPASSKVDTQAGEFACAAK